MKYNIGIRALKKLVNKRTQPRRFPPFQEVKEVLLAWDENQNEKDSSNIHTIIQFLESHKIHVFKVIYYHKRKKANIPESTDANTIHLSKLDFNAFGMPKTSSVKKIMAQPFDYFINLNLDGRLPLKSVAGFTKSACRIGYNRKKALDFYDLLLGNPESEDMEQYVKDLIFYLQKIG